MSVFASLCALSSASFAFQASDAPDAQPVRATIMADTTPPIANITSLPEQVSNGTWVTVNGNESSDPSGIILNHTWEVEHGGVVVYEYAELFMFKFAELGLYTIKLTVTDGGNNSDVDFTAVYAILDSDFDELPDWWEDYYFRDLDEDDQGDLDEDGYTNIEEYMAGTDPEVHDAAPSGILEAYWPFLVVASVVVVAIILAMIPRQRRKRKQDEDVKIKTALEIEKALETED